MKKERKKKEKASAKSEEKDLKEILKPIDFPKEGDSLGAGDPSLIRVGRREKKQDFIRPEEIPIEEVLGIREEEKEPVSLILGQEEEEEPTQILEQTIQDEYPEKISSNDIYGGPKDTISYNTDSSGVAYSGTEQSQGPSGTYTASGGSGGAYEGTSKPDQGGGYDPAPPQISAPRERIGEIRDTSSSALESKFVKMAKSQKFQFSTDQGY